MKALELSPIKRQQSARELHDELTDALHRLTDEASQVATATVANEASIANQLAQTLIVGAACPRCGTPNRPDAQTCVICGAPLRNQAQQPATPETNVNQQEMPSSTPSPRSVPPVPVPLGAHIVADSQATTIPRSTGRQPSVNKAAGTIAQPIPFAGEQATAIADPAPTLAPQNTAVMATMSASMISSIGTPASVILTDGVFVSHSHEDNAYCRTFILALREAQIDVWYDEKDLSQGELLRRIQVEIYRRPIFVVILSDAAINHSTWVNTESQWGYERYMHDRQNRRFLPVRATHLTSEDFGPDWLFLQSIKRIEGDNRTPLSPHEAAQRVIRVIHELKEQG